ncbi:MAG: Uma2 family endonuclease [Dehalococcoidia bacterium]
MATAPDVRPELDSGDRLTREEFHRRYCRRPDLHKAELVNGVVYVPSPARWGKHGKHQSIVQWWLGGYAMDRPEIGVGDNDTVYLSPDDEVQPDAFLFRLTGPNRGARETDEGYIEGAPELIVEVAASSASYDLHDKKEAYRRAGVLEYIAWRVLDEAIDWFRLQNGEYVLVQPNADGVIESTVFPGLRLNVAAMLAGDRAGVLSALRK